MNNETMQIRISDVIHALLKHRILIVIMTVVGLGIGIILSVVSYMRGEMAKQYAITTSIAVTAQTGNGYFTTRSSDPNSTDIYLAENMVDSVIYLMRSDRTLDAAVEKLNLVGISTRDIYSNLNMKQYNETQIIEITLYWRSAEEGVQILNAINTVSPKILIDVLKIGGVSVVNNPTARYRIGGSLNASMWVYMSVLGMMAGVGFSLLQMLLQPTLVNVRDITKLFGLEILGEIPFNKKYFSIRRSMLAEDESGVGENVRQSYATSAHIVANRLGKEPSQCFYITSASPNEGKTNVAANLAVQLSDLEKKVLLIDFDVRNPSLGSLFLEKVDYAHSINAVYRGETAPEDAVVQLSGFLDLLPAILERQETPLDEAMLGIVRELSQKYDYVLMDTAPVGRVADTMSLNRIAQKALFVIRHDFANLNDIRESLEILDKSGVRVMGCIVNSVKRIGNDSAAQYYRAYGKRKMKYGPQETRLNNLPRQEITHSRNVVTEEELMQAAAAEVYAQDALAEESSKADNGK